MTNLETIIEADRIAGNLERDWSTIKDKARRDRLAKLRGVLKSAPHVGALPFPFPLEPCGPFQEVKGDMVIENKHIIVPPGGFNGWTSNGIRKIDGKHLTVRNSIVDNPDGYGIWCDGQLTMDNVVVNAPGYYSVRGSISRCRITHCEFTHGHSLRAYGCPDFFAECSKFMGRFMILGCGSGNWTTDSHQAFVGEFERCYFEWQELGLADQLLMMMFGTKTAVAFNDGCEFIMRGHRIAQIGGGKAAFNGAKVADEPGQPWRVPVPTDFASFSEQVEISNG